MRSNAQHTSRAYTTEDMNLEKGKECSTTFSVLRNTEPLSKLAIKNPRKKELLGRFFYRESTRVRFTLLLLTGISVGGLCTN